MKRGMVEDPSQDSFSFVLINQKTLAKLRVHIWSVLSV